MPAQLTLYTRHGCHLCEDMAMALATLADELSFTTHVIDIDDDTGLAQIYGARVPVLMLEEQQICEYFLDPQALRQVLSKHLDD